MTRIIYDTTGHILDQRQGSDLYTPVGVPYLDLEIPAGKQLERLDVSVPPNVLVYVDLPKTEVQIMQERLTATESALLALMDASLPK